MKNEEGHLIVNSYGPLSVWSGFWQASPALHFSEVTQTLGRVSVWTPRLSNAVKHSKAAEKDKGTKLAKKKSCVKKATDLGLLPYSVSSVFLRSLHWFLNVC